MRTNYFKNAVRLCLLMGIFFMTMTSCKNDKMKDAKEGMEEMADQAMEKTEEVMDKAEGAVNDMADGVKESTRTVYNLTEVDTPPLFDKSCEGNKDPRKCSDDKLLDFVKKNAKFPKKAKSNAKSLEQVVVIIEEDGSISSTKYVASENEESCEGCQQAAADVVGLMGNWVPATKGGNPVAVRFTIPIKFENN